MRAPCLYSTLEALRTNKQESTEPRRGPGSHASSFPASTPPQLCVGFPLGLDMPMALLYGPLICKPELLKWELLVFPEKNSPVCQDPVNSWLVAMGPLGTSCSRWEEGEEWATVFLAFRLVSRAPCLAFLVLRGSLFTFSPRLTHAHTHLAPAWLSYLQLIPQTCALSLPGLCTYHLQDQYPGS